MLAKSPWSLGLEPMQVGGLWRIQPRLVCRNLSLKVRWHRFFFFSSRRRHTRFDCDWSSDVCSSDLMENGREVVIVEAVRTPIGRGHPEKGYYKDTHPNELLGKCYTEVIERAGIPAEEEIGRASCRERV